ncbi:tRNA 2-selenouridine(34) synthase MnmH [Parendozoicomonas sp. Alg238-R29]|uniref:tRNA 2-selenouridine(34) synthase MnmH n=1 Tax=Parendozoicomonas sp. Alg238-R29 TaxID=2993446 RepID=UPI00248E5159|nr:tRNA 2-selenouridine(34) synthase MnmH [Parendozoicomonas sp. Alg238-R29]
MTDTRPNTCDYRRLFLENIPLLDVRAPIEYDKGAFPKSTNSPLLNDEERAQIGTCYKRKGHDAAVELGHQLVAGETRDERTQSWIEFTQQHPAGYIYCFRGGERSHMVQSWLKEGGVDYPLITGGYKALRNWLLDYLEDSIDQCRFIILGGKTGTGKTRLLTRSPDHIDLEGLANHSGSSFGRRVGGQPTQIGFENNLAINLLKLRDQGINTFLLEDESKLIGRCCLPPTLKAKMDTAPILLLEEDLETRVQITFEEYISQNLKENIALHGEEKGFGLFSEELLASIDRIRKRLGGVRHQEYRSIMEEALEQQQNGEEPSRHKDWIAALLRDYYDPMYEYQLEQKQDRIVATGNQQQLAEEFLLSGALSSLTPAY